MRKVREVLRLKHALGVSERQIANTVGVSRSTVGEYLRRAAVIGITWPVPEGMDDGELERRLFTPPTFDEKPTRPLPDWMQVHRELKRRGVTLLLLWEEYRAEHADGYGYSRFCDLYREWCGTISPTKIHLSTIIAPIPLDEFDVLKREAIEAASDTADAYIQNWTRFVIGWEECHRGRMTEARDVAQELMQVGRLLGDPRSTGLGLALMTWIALVADSYAEALEYSEQSLGVAVTHFDRSTAVIGKGCALVLLRRTEDGTQLLEGDRRRCIADGDIYRLAGSDGMIGVCKVLQGNIRDGIRFLEEAILRRETGGLSGRCGLV
jgi:hypothetical protein